MLWRGMWGGGRQARGTWGHGLAGSMQARREASLWPVCSAGALVVRWFDGLMATSGPPLQYSGEPPEPAACAHEASRAPPENTATDANGRLWRFNRQIEKPRKTSNENRRPSCPQKIAVTSKAARRRPPHDHRPRPVEVAFLSLVFSPFFYDFAEKIAWRRKCREEAQTPSRFL